MLLFMQFSFSYSAAAQPKELPAHAPQICTGELRYPDRTEYGYLKDTSRCPENHVLLGVAGAGRPQRGKPETVKVLGYCCPLPAADILTTEETAVAGKCPEHYVAVGRKMECPGCDTFLLCAKINTQRYHLSAPRSGIHWGLTSAPWRHPKSVFKNDIPPALRYGLTRYDRLRETTSGCLGYPFGTVLTAKSYKYCHDFSYRQLLYLGIPGDPPAGTAVSMYPECTTVTGVFSGKERCVE